MKRKNTKKVDAIEKANKFHRAFTSRAITIEDFFRRNKGNLITVKHVVTDECVNLTFRAYPLPCDETTGAIDLYDGYCMRFGIEPKLAIDNLVKYLREKPVRENF